MKYFKAQHKHYHLFAARAYIAIKQAHRKCPITALVRVYRVLWQRVQFCWGRSGATEIHFHDAVMPRGMRRWCYVSNTWYALATNIWRGRQRKRRARRYHEMFVTVAFAPTNAKIIWTVLCQCNVCMLLWMCRAHLSTQPIKVCARLYVKEKTLLVQIL